MFNGGQEYAMTRNHRRPTPDLDSPSGNWPNYMPNPASCDVSGWQCGRNKDSGETEMPQEVTVSPCTRLALRSGLNSVTVTHISEL